PDGTPEPGPGLPPAARAAAMRLLAREPAGTPVWFAASRRSPGALALVDELRALFVEAGWTVRGVVAVDFPVRPGVFVFAADEAPPAFVEAARAGLEAAGLSPRPATGYRSYYAEMKRTQPGWNGFAFAAEQSFLIVVGQRERGGSGVTP
ncbi:MAG: hypothetical protein JXB32_06350, partial [Deltaproteobacteria bacterium]|nr:hypothetical protein [Deltaproteobacteria bacterium]